MNIRNYIRNGLLALAVGSVVYVVVAEVRDHRRAAATAKAIAAESALVGPETRLIVYYFSEGKECTTCEQIPVFAKEALDTSFAPELASGAVVWRTVDVDERRNEHFIAEFGIYTKSIVLVKMNKGTQVRWKNLDEVWDKVYDRKAFVAYVGAQVREMLDAAS